MLLVSVLVVAGDVAVDAVVDAMLSLMQRNVAVCFVGADVAVAFNRPLPILRIHRYKQHTRRHPASTPPGPYGYR